MIKKWWERVHAGLRLALYPPCDHLNQALNFLLVNPVENRVAIEEICYAIIKSGGYYFPHVTDELAAYGFSSFITKEAHVDG